MLNILEMNIRDSVKLSTMMNHVGGFNRFFTGAFFSSAVLFSSLAHCFSGVSQGNDSMDEERLWRELIMERVTKSADACLTALNIMTAAHMPKAVYIEDVIERVLQYIKFHLQSSLYPQYDPAYRADPHGGANFFSPKLQHQAINITAISKSFETHTQKSAKYLLAIIPIEQDFKGCLKTFFRYCIINVLNFFCSGLTGEGVLSLHKAARSHQSPRSRRAPATSRRWWSCSTAKSATSSAACRSSWRSSC